MDAPKWFAIEVLSAAEAAYNYPALWATATNLLPELSSEQIALVVSLAADTCHVCKSENGDCQCWNDD